MVDDRPTAIPHWQLWAAWATAPLAYSAILLCARPHSISDVGDDPMMVDVGPIGRMLQLHIASAILTFFAGTTPGVPSRTDFRVLAAYWFTMLTGIPLLALLQSQALGLAWQWLLHGFAPAFVLASITTALRRRARATQK